MAVAGLGVDIRKNKPDNKSKGGSTTANKTNTGGSTTVLKNTQPVTQVQGANALSQNYTPASNSNYQVQYNGSGTTTYSPTSTTTYKPQTTTTYSPAATGNYTIGSELGMQVAFNMPIGSTYRASDGALWKKENDGTVTADYNGVITKNAYTMPDQGVLGQQQMAAGLPWYYVNNTLVGRNNKIANDSALAQYAGDAVTQQMQNYINRAIREQNQPDVSAQELYTYFKDTQPTYTDQYDPQIQALLNEILNRDDFSYDKNIDPLYQQYASTYQREGDRAMRETMAEAAAYAGGMNSYAITAAQQANNYYGAQLADKIPELYNLAYEMYLQEMDNEIQKMGILQNMSDRDYARYRDTMNDWWNDKNFAYGMYRDDVADGKWQTEFDYTAFLDNRDFNHGVNREQINDQRYDKEWEKAEENDAKAEIEWLIGMGASFESINADLIAKAGLTENAVKEMIAKEANKNFKKASSGNGGGTPRNDVVEEEEEDVKGAHAVYDLGLGPVIDGDNLIVALHQAGAIGETEDGKVYWQDGWNEKNYKSKLQEQK